MKEILFRAWDKERNRYMSRDEIISEIYIGSGGKDSCTFWFGSLFDDIITEQYTGLKDCNGKRIFEGDIVNSEYRYGVGEVYFDTIQACWKIGFEEIDSKLWIFCCSYIKLKVIGNIHQDGHLIEGGK